MFEVHLICQEPKFIVSRAQQATSQESISTLSIIDSCFSPMILGSSGLSPMIELDI